MKASSLLALVLTLALPAAVAADCGQCAAGCGQEQIAAGAGQLLANSATYLTPTAAPAGDGIKRHPLKGVVVAVNAERSAVMIKHEEIVGVMRAMTMMFKVDAAALKGIQKGQTITGMMSRQGNEWVLEDVKVVPAK